MLTVGIIERPTERIYWVGSSGVVESARRLGRGGQRVVDG